MSVAYNAPWFLEFANSLIKSAVLELEPAQLFLLFSSIITFMGAWNYFLFPLVLANDEKHYTLSIGIALLKNQSGSNLGVQIAGATIAVAPIVVVLTFFQKYIKAGFATEGIKG